MLTVILESTREEVAKRKRERSLASLEATIRESARPRPFRTALDRAAASGFGLVAEIKRASPSQGLIRADFNPAELARAYEEGGAACLSVLTNETWFRGSERHLEEARAASGLPVLRKDFLIDPWQVAESRAIGADCVLVILAALDDGRARELCEAARDAEMDVLVEVHDRTELDRALALGADLVGINNRNLNTFETDLAVTETLAAASIPDGCALVSESGVRTRADIVRLSGFGVRRFLVGESLMRADDVEAATRSLLQPASSSAATWQ